MVSDLVRLSSRGDICEGAPSQGPGNPAPQLALWVQQDIRNSWLSNLPLSVIRYEFSANCTDLVVIVQCSWQGWSSLIRCRGGGSWPYCCIWVCLGCTAFQTAGPCKGGCGEGGGVAILVRSRVCRAFPRLTAPRSPLRCRRPRRVHPEARFDSRILHTLRAQCESEVGGFRRKRVLGSTRVASCNQGLARPGL